MVSENGLDVAIEIDGARKGRWQLRKVEIGGRYGSEQTATTERTNADLPD
jgi:hypothetical protein